jgi:LytS/YehU family sensor histidine kinase
MDKILYVAHMVGAIVIGILGVLISSPVGLTGGARYFMGCSGFVIGYVVMTIVLGVIGSGISTIYVCFAEDREALRRNNPELHDAIMDTFGGKMLANATTSV